MEVLKESSELRPTSRFPQTADDAARKLRRAGAVAAIVIVAGALAGLLPRWHQRTALAKAARESSLPLVAVVAPSLQESPAELVLPAEIKPFVEAPIYPRVNGYVRRWTADIGATVKQDEILAEIDAPELDQELVQARAQLFMAESALPLAKATAARWAELVKTQSVSQQEAAEKASELKLKLAAVDVARANVARLEELQKFEKIRAPFDGTVASRNIDVGQLVTAGSSTELFRLAQTKRLRVFVRVPQVASIGVTPGQMAELSIPEFPGRSFQAKVVRSSGTLSADSRTLLTELEVDNAQGEIVAGAFAQVRFPQARPNRPVTVPSNTLLFRPEGTQVGVVDSKGKVELRTIAIGRDFGPSIEVLAGLSTNDRVILNPSDSLESGSTVQAAAGAKQ